MTPECGILDWGVALPRRRLENRVTQAAWDRPPMPGSRRVAGPDEDALTLGVQAALQAARRDGGAPDASDVTMIDALIFAGTTAPFAERSCAGLIADTLDLRPEARCLDVALSRRSGANALALACDLVTAGAARRVLVVAADVRQAKPGAQDECLTGHAGAALLVGAADDAAVRILQHAQRRHSQADVWRASGSRFAHAEDARFSRVAAYAAPMQAVLGAILQAAGWSPGDVRHAVVFSPDVKSGAALLKKNGFDVKAQYCDRVSRVAGLTGTAHTPLMLIAALEESKAGDRLIMLDQGDGAAAFAFQMREDTDRDHFKTAASQGYDISYNRYLTAHRLHAGVDADDRPFTSEAMAERHKRLWRALVGRRCLACNTIVTLPLPTCPHCARQTDFADVPLQRTGTVFATTREHFFPTPEPPLGMAVVNLDGGGRLTLQVADEDGPLEIDDRVELVLRRLHQGGGMPNYFWKCRSVGPRPGGGP